MREGLLGRAMDTPERGNVAGTPISKFEDSPVFNFINSLSPIQPVKSAHSIQAYTSPGFSSISSVFSSPHINLQKESRFLIRQPYSEPSKPGNPCDNVGGSSSHTGVSDGVQLSTPAAAAQDNCIIKCSLNEATVDPPDECLALTSRLHEFTYDCGSPDHNITPCYGGKLDLKLNIGCTGVELVSYVPDGLDNRKSLFAAETVQENNLNEPAMEEVSGCDWENLMANDASDPLIFNDSTELEAHDGRDEKLGDKGDATFSFKIPEDVVDDSQKTQPDASFGSCLENTTQEPPIMYSVEFGEKDEKDHTPQITASTFQNLAGVSNQCWEGGDGTDDRVSFDCKADSQQQRGMRRRCLVFDVSGLSRRNSQNDSNVNSSDSLPSSGRFSSDSRPSSSSKPGARSSPCILPGIGLHLNTLASTSKDRKMTQEALASARGVISMPCSVGSFPLTTARQTSLDRSLAVENDQGIICSDAQDFQDDASQAPEFGSCEELSQSSPKKKRQKSDSNREGEACKRCNCKKSKCLKLYCECFAAGVYCIEPCSCQGCYNKPIHEETVLATRKLIESRNPLAFAPRVIHNSDAILDTGEEANQTPASARHKRGCNCKKSSCLKKYCECYQGGVGCSISCRCEGCKNTYGRKDGVVPMVIEDIEHGEEEMDDRVKEEMPDYGQTMADVHKDAFQLPEGILLTTPLQVCRTSAKLPLFSSQKPLRSTTLPVEYSPLLNTSQLLRKSEALPQCILGKHVKSVSEDEAPEILIANASPSSCVKTASPKSKRVSPPHNGFRISPSCKGGRKLILKSIASFPSLNSDVTDHIQ